MVEAPTKGVLRSEYQRKWREANREHLLASKRKYHADNREAELVRMKDLYKANIDERRAKSKDIYHANPGADTARLKERYQKNREAELQRRRENYQNNKSAYVARAKFRKNMLRNRVPAWADRAAIDAVYAEACRLRSLGLDVHVDHIIPLQGKTVSGFHVANNLQILSARENMEKGNKFGAEA